jgi:hypothetical protein
MPKGGEKNPTAKAINLFCVQHPVCRIVQREEGTNTSNRRMRGFTIGDPPQKVMICVMLYH